MDWSAGSVSLLTDAQPWPAGGRVRRAGISSFGISGTNAHVIVEEAPAEQRATGGSTAPVVPWVVSAKSATALQSQAARLAEYVGAQPEVDIADVGWSLAGRATFEHRAVVIGGDRARLRPDVGHGQPAGGAVARLARVPVEFHPVAEPGPH